MQKSYTYTGLFDFQNSLWKLCHSLQRHDSYRITWPHCCNKHQALNEIKSFCSILCLLSWKLLVNNSLVSTAMVYCRRENLSSSLKMFPVSTSNSSGLSFQYPKILLDLYYYNTVPHSYSFKLYKQSDLQDLRKEPLPILQSFFWLLWFLFNTSTLFEVH